MEIRYTNQRIPGMKRRFAGNAGDKRGLWQYKTGMRLYTGSMAGWGCSLQVASALYGTGVTAYPRFFSSASKP